MGLKQTVVRRNERRDMLYLLAVLSHTLLPLPGKAGQELGMERMLRASRPGEISLLPAGAAPPGPAAEHAPGRLHALMDRFGEILLQHALFPGIPGLL